MFGSVTSAVIDRQLSFSGLIVSNTRANQLVKTVYYLNAIVVLVGLGYTTQAQKDGKYRCNTIDVMFDEVIWESVQARDGRNEDRLLMYSYFNGLYKGEVLAVCKL